MTKKLQDNSNDEKIIPAELLNLMSALARDYINRCELWQTAQKNNDQISKLNETIKKLETKIFNYDYHPLKHTLNELEFSEDEKRIFVLLFVLKTDRAVFKLYIEKIEGANNSRRPYLCVGALVEILFESYSDRIKNRKLFSTDSALVKHDIFSLESRDDEMISNWEIEMNQRYINFVLGDNNTYAASDFIKIDDSSVSFDSIILEEAIKKDIINALDNYDAYQKKIEEFRLNGVFEYGFGYTFMFYGPSGTGKTMLAHAIAKHLNKKLITYSDNSENGDRRWNRRNNNSQLSRVFLEAALHNGVLFFDECSDMFRKDTQESRELLIQLEQSNVIVIFATNNVYDLSPALERRILFKYRIKVPNTSLREKLWNHFLNKIGVTCIKQDTIREISERYNMPGGFIKNAALKYINSKISGAINGIELDRIAELYYQRYIESSFALKLSKPSRLTDKNLNTLNTDTKNIIDKIIKSAKIIYSLNPADCSEIPSLNLIISSNDENTGMKISQHIVNKLQRSYIRFSSNYKDDEQFADDCKKKFILSYLQADAADDIRDTRPVLIFDHQEEKERSFNVRLEYAECLINSTKNSGILRILLISGKPEKKVLDAFNPDFSLYMQENRNNSEIIDAMLQQNNIELEKTVKTKIIEECRNSSKLSKFKKIIGMFQLRKNNKQNDFNEYLDLFFSDERQFETQLFG